MGTVRLGKTKWGTFCAKVCKTTNIGATHADTLKSYASLASLQSEVGMYAEARQLYETVIAAQMDTIV